MLTRTSWPVSRPGWLPPATTSGSGQTIKRRHQINTMRSVENTVNQRRHVDSARLQCSWFPSNDFYHHVHSEDGPGILACSAELLHCLRTSSASSRRSVAGHGATHPDRLLSIPSAVRRCHAAFQPVVSNQAGDGNDHAERGIQQFLPNTDGEVGGLDLAPLNIHLMEHRDQT